MHALLTIGIAAYAITTVGYLLDLFKPSGQESSLPIRCYVFASAYWVVAFPYGAISYPLCTGVRPWLIASAWSLGVIYLVLARRYQIRALGSSVAALSAILSTFALLVSTGEAHLLTGPLADWVLWIHIALAFIGVTAFSLAAAVSVIYLFVSGRLKRKQVIPKTLPPLDTLDTLALRAVSVGFAFYTVALLLGTAQAVRQGSGEVKLAYVFAAISWGIYGVVLQARMTAGWRGRKAAILTIVGLISALVVVGLYGAGLT
jgi:ABC-type uncharacterized transport system permease subunit